MPELLQVLLMSVLSAYCFERCIYLRRRNLQSWESIVGQIRFESGDPGSTDLSCWTEFLVLTRSQISELPCTSRGLRRVFRKARVALEMADYAERNGRLGESPVAPVLLASLRRDAMQIRISALLALTRCLLSESRG
jgi:hypothetical protein